MAWAGQMKLDRTDFGVVGGNRFNPGFDLAAVALGDSIDVTLNVFARRISALNLHYSNGPKPSIGAVLDSVIDRDGIDEAVARYRGIVATDPTGYDLGEAQLTLLGYRLLEKGRAHEAERIFALNAAAYPDSPNAYDSLGEARLAAGRREPAVGAYRKELDLDPNSTSALAALGWLGG